MRQCCPADMRPGDSRDLAMTEKRINPLTQSFCGLPKKTVKENVILYEYVPTRTLSIFPAVFCLCVFVGCVSLHSWNSFSNTVCVKGHQKCAEEEKDVALLDKADPNRNPGRRREKATPLLCSQILFLPFCQHWTRYTTTPRILIF